MVLYRKYRPQKLSELDLTQVRQKLLKTVSAPYRPHAYLFCGPKGTGKTSAARIVAKILNCEKVNPKDKAEPCNKCESCLAITAGRHMDVIEIDAASNRGIDEIRDLREKIGLAPVSAKFKVYIIDEVHMLTNDAFNALLKTLEEPPQHAVFILATTEVEKLPETIISRSTRFDFQKAAKPEIRHALERVIAGEKIKIDSKGIDLISNYADGSFRDATKILEQVVNQKAEKYQEVAKLLGLDAINPSKFLILLKHKKTRELLETIVAMAEKGADFKFFAAEMLDILHKMLLATNQIEQEGLSEDLKNLFDMREIINLIKVFSEVFVNTRYASRGELPLTTAVVELCQGKEEINNV